MRECLSSCAALLSLKCQHVAKQCSLSLCSQVLIFSLWGHALAAPPSEALLRRVGVALLSSAPLDVDLSIGNASHPHFDNVETEAVARQSDSS